MSAARDRWLDEGIEVLVEEGSAGVRIDRLAARLGLSKGSFHHHFAGADGFKKDLLDHVEDILTSSLQQAIDAARGEPTARRILMGLIEMVTASDDQVYRPRLEIALRAWALADVDAARTQERVDAARVGALRRVWRRVSDDDDDVRIGAMLPYVLALGATVIMPPLSSADLRKLYERILPLVPDDLA
ncbi:TetR/AcrR family transcriptional regulator [Propionibacteriaceae bacterium Y2011]